MISNRFAFWQVPFFSVNNSVLARRSFAAASSGSSSRQRRREETGRRRQCMCLLATRCDYNRWKPLDRLEFVLIAGSTRVVTIRCQFLASSLQDHPGTTHMPSRLPDNRSILAARHIAKVSSSYTNIDPIHVYFVLYYELCNFS